MPCDLTKCVDNADGYYKMNRSTLQIAGEEDYLKREDIFYSINGEELIYKNKFELISLLSSLNGISEICVLRKVANNCLYGMSLSSSSNEVPYYNGIFAQNSIKLAMRKYEKPTMKSGSEVDFCFNNKIENEDERIQINAEKQLLSENITNEQDSGKYYPLFK
jgi:hypothetical protein